MQRVVLFLMTLYISWFCCWLECLSASLGCMIHPHVFHSGQTHPRKPISMITGVFSCGKKRLKIAENIPGS